MCTFSSNNINSCEFHIVAIYKRIKGRVPLSISDFVECAVFVLLFIISCQISFVACGSTDSNEPEGIHVASWNWDHAGIYITFTTFIVLSGLAKVGE